MSTDPRNLKIRIRMSGPSSAPAVEIPATTDTSSRPAIVITGGVIAALLIGWGFWVLLAQRNHEAPSAEVADAPQVTASPAEVSPHIDASTPTPIESAKTAPSPAAHKTPATTPTHTPVKESGASSGGTNLVVRAVLAEKMRNHQPANELGGEVPASDVTKRLYFFTEVHDLGTRRFTHRWEYRGKPVAQINFKPSGKNWSGSSSKQIPTHMQGEWRVVLVDGQGHDLTSVEFVYGANAPASN